jgi:hypothetical protein
MPNETPPDDWDASSFAKQLDPSVGGIETQLADARAVMVGDPPTITPPSDGMVTLNRGLLFEDEWNRVAYMRETTGADEEALARFDLSKPVTLFQYWETLLSRTVLTIGSLDFTEMATARKQTLLRSLLLGDREALFLGLVRATWGPIRTLEGVQCPRCGEMSDQNIVLDEDFPATQLNDPEQDWYEVKLRKGDTVDLRLPTGDDILQISNALKPEASAAERNTMMIGLLVGKHNGNPIPNGTKFAQDLGTPDRQTLTTFAIETQPGPRLGGVTTSCASCKEEYYLELGLARLLQLGT